MKDGRGAGREVHVGRDRLAPKGSDRPMERDDIELPPHGPPPPPRRRESLPHRPSQAQPAITSRSPPPSMILVPAPAPRPPGGPPHPHPPPGGSPPHRPHTTARPEDL